MNHRQSYIALLLVGALSLAGCGGANDQDTGSGGGETSLSGVGVDGYLARSIVWMDLDADGQLDGFEPRAFTDDQGYFGYNPITGTDYCGDDETAMQRQFCLTGRADGATTIRMTGGYDTTTGEPFDGVLTLRATSGTAGLTVSPLGALLASAGGDQREALLAKLSLPSNGGTSATVAQAGSDFLADLGDDVNVDLLEMALQAHKVVTALADGLEDRYDRIGEDPDLPITAGSVVYDALVEELLASSNDFPGFIDDAAALEAVLGNAETRIRARYADAGLTPPAAMDAGVTGPLAGVAVEVAAVVSSTVSNVVRNDGLGGDRGQRARGAARAVEVVVKKIIKGDPDHADAAQWAKDNPADVSSLGGGNKDINALIEGDMDPTNANHSSDADIPADAMQLTNVIDGRLAIRHSAAGRSGAVLMYFLGQSGDSQGEWQSCVRYAGDEDLATDGLLLDGHWSLPDPGNPYVMLVSADLLGSGYAMRVRSVDVTDANQAVFRFDYDDSGSDTWTGAPTVEAIDPAAIPADDAACRQALTERFGQG